MKESAKGRFFENHILNIFCKWNILLVRPLNLLRCPFWLPLLSITFGHQFKTTFFGPHFLTSLLYITFVCHFWMYYLDIAFGNHFWTSLLDITFVHNFCTLLLDITFGHHSWTSNLTLFWTTLSNGHFGCHCHYIRVAGKVPFSLG